MAAPPSVTTKNLSGVFISNRHLSDSADELLRLQNVSWHKRKMAQMFNVALYTKHYTDDNGVEHIDMDQKLVGGIPGGSDNHTLDWQERDVTDLVFGLLSVKTHRVSLESIEDEFLKTDWTEDTIADGVIHTVISNKNPGDGHAWKAEQTWGFQLVDGERRHVRLASLTSSGKTDGPQCVRTVYDYCKSYSTS
ncbi:hypothetical protein EDC04DRAFT_2619802 [Pisolithus marmoratus]|nr:hypothetical protein EDC04DRAFT_2619802 [Pisolithus marmoratus]